MLKRKKQHANRSALRITCVQETGKRYRIPQLGQRVTARAEKLKSIPVSSWCVWRGTHVGRKLCIHRLAGLCRVGHEHPSLLENALELHNLPGRRFYRCVNDPQQILHEGICLQVVSSVFAPHRSNAEAPDAQRT